MSKHGKELERKFEEQERQRRERLGKQVEAPASKPEEKKQTPVVEPFNISYGQRA